MSRLYPLRFQPLLRRYIWGGRRLESLGKALGPGNDYAESWEIVDRGEDQSVVSAGPLRGTSLQQLVREHGAALLGEGMRCERFPLLFKFLDASSRLSIQVHPDDARAAQLDPPDLGKTEAWVILAAERGSHLFAGLRRNIDRQTLEAEMERRCCELCIERLEPRAGDCYFLPAGVVHALGGGLLVAEIQQASDTTYRLHDWDRVGPDGRPRTLHVAEALEAIDYQYGPVEAQTPQPDGRPGVERLVACDKFLLDRHHLGGDAQLGGDGRFHILAVLDGTLAIDGDPAETALEKGSVALLPASLEATQVSAPVECELLDCYLP